MTREGEDSFIVQQANEIVEAVRLAVLSYAAGENSYLSSTVKALDGPAA